MTFAPDIGGLVMFIFFLTCFFFALGAISIKFLFFYKGRHGNIKKLKSCLFSYLINCLFFYFLICLFVNFSYKKYINVSEGYSDLLFFLPIVYQAFIRGMFGFIFFVESNKMALLYNIIAYIILDLIPIIFLGSFMLILILPVIPFYYWYMIKKANKFKMQQKSVWIWMI